MMKSIEKPKSANMQRSQSKDEAEKFRRVQNERLMKYRKMLAIEFCKVTRIPEWMKVFSAN